MDLSGWLRSLGLQQYEGAFRENAIEPDVLPKLTNEDLKELGVILVGHRRKLLDAIATLRTENTRPSERYKIPGHAVGITGRCDWRAAAGDCAVRRSCRLHRVGSAARRRGSARPA